MVRFSLPALALAMAESCLEYTRIHTMKKTTITTHAAEALLKKGFVSFPRFAQITIQDLPHPEAGFIASAILTVKDEVFSLNGQIIKDTKEIISGDRKFIVSEPANWKASLTAALAAVREDWATRARLFCDDQDQAFLNSHGG